MADGRVYWIITTYGDDGLVSHFDWEIVTRSAIIKNRFPIKSDKTTCYNSLALHCKNFLRLKLNPLLVKNRNEGSAGYEEKR